MTAVLAACVVMLAAAAALALVRAAVGPTMLDRVIALDVVVSVVVIALAVEAAVNRHASTLPVIVVLALVGFVGAVSVARYAARDGLEDPAEEQSGGERP
ncbi:monovalent cation/H+ antiporter complex subunit F [Kineococcus terrestris]|uniref:monovalent cation/H+ antiporter complex subunit F n=1 Tax=Kineococcus terrestris TaxID=2044856 RepID=UPI0034DB2200